MKVGEGQGGKRSLLGMGGGQENEELLCSQYIAYKCEIQRS